MLACCHPELVSGTIRHSEFAWVLKQVQDDIANCLDFINRQSLGFPYRAPSEYYRSMIDVSDDEWKKKLTPEQYHVLREKGTEVPGTGALLHNHKDGKYTCAACGTVLFESGTKFESGSGWPSFYDAIPGTVTLTEDGSLGMSRTEATCTNCGSHLG